MNSPKPASWHFLPIPFIPKPSISAKQNQQLPLATRVQNLFDANNKNQVLYDLCRIYGIPAATKQERYSPILKDAPEKIEALEKIIIKNIELWCLGIFVCLEVTNDNLMRNNDRIVMTGFDGRCSEDNFITDVTHSVIFATENRRSELL